MQHTSNCMTLYYLCYCTNVVCYVCQSMRAQPQQEWGRPAAGCEGWGGKQPGGGGDKIVIIT